MSYYNNAAYCHMYDDTESIDETLLEPVSVPVSVAAHSPRRTPHRWRQRSFSAPRHQNTLDVFAPMMAQARGRDPPAIRRSRSAVFTKEAEDRRPSLGDLSGQRSHPPRRTISFGQNGGYEDRSFQSARRCLAVIPPNTRPLLSSSPAPASLEKSSWATLPTAPRHHTLWLSGLFLLLTSTVNCLLCFYLLAKLGLQKGRQYYIDLAAVSGFAMLVLGFAAVRTGRYSWVLNRNYLSGYMVLSMLDVLLCAVLGLLASDWSSPHKPEILEISTGAVCGLSTLMLLLALCLGVSNCCRSPPPDNRVAHSVPSFIV